ncbi:MAG: MFS transporter [Actinobacteria bacterium]|nr:MAG: MFS transporter [Actinomycetota bacterium]
MRRWWRGLVDGLGPVGIFPLGVLLGLSTVERFDFFAFGVLSPEIRHTFHLSNAGFLSIAALTAALPILLSVPVGYLGDRYRRVRITQVAGVVWGITAVLTGLAPAVLVLVLARLLGGAGLLVNESVHPSLLADYYPPPVLPRVMGIHRQAFVLGAFGSPIAGALSTVFGWRTAFVILALPTFLLVLIARWMREPARGATLAVPPPPGDDKVGFAEAFRRLRSIRSLRRTWPAAFLFGSGVLPFAAVLNNFFHDVYGSGAVERGLITFLTGVGGFIGLVLGTRWAQKLTLERGPQWLPVINGLFVIEFAVGMVLMALSPWMTLSIAFAFVLSIGTLGFLPAYLTMVALVAPPRLRAQAFSWTLLFYGLGAIVLSPIAGAVGDAHGYRVAILLLSAFVGGGGLIELTARAFVPRDVEQAANIELAGASEALLSCSKVDVAYDQVQVLFRVDLDVHEGEIVALLGTNGAGKSTLLKAISGLLDPIGGAIFFDGRDVTHADPITTAKLGIAQVPGGRGIFPTLSVGENLRVAGWLYRGESDYLKEATERVLEYFPILRTRWDTPAGNLSGGEQQMLSLGQAFIARPKLLLIDELSLGLAPTVVERLLEIVRAIHDNGTTIILVEQSVNVALRLAERAFFLEKGEVRFSGRTAELLERKDILRAVFLRGAAAVADEELVARTNGEASGEGQAQSARKRAQVAEDVAARHADHRAALLLRPAALQVRGLSKRFGGIAAGSDVDLTLHEGEILGLIGPNGAGKTTIFDLICGFQPADSGRVELHGVDMSRWGPSRRAGAGLGRSFQDARLWPSLTVREALAVALERHIDVRNALPALLGMPLAADSEEDVFKRVDELVELMGLRAFANKFVSELSTGSRRIVEIAAILGHRPTVLILDEPSSGIAQKETEALGPLLQEARAYLDCSMLVIEHDMPLISRLADHLVALDRGSVVVHGPPADVLQHPYVIESYLGTTDEKTLVQPSGAAEAVGV